MNKFFYRLRVLSCTTFGCMSMIIVMFITTITHVDGVNGFMHLIALILIALFCGFISRICYDSHFILRHLVAIWMVIITDFHNITTFGTKISRGMDDVRNECKNVKEFYSLVLKLYDAYYREVKKNGS